MTFTPDIWCPTCGERLLAEDVDGLAVPCRSCHREWPLQRLDSLTGGVA